jgi:hypothetical protein
MGMSCETKQVRNIVGEEFVYRDGTNVQREICDYTGKMGAIGILKAVLKKNLDLLPGKHSADSVRKTAVLGTRHITESAAVRNLEPERWGSL